LLACFDEAYICVTEDWENATGDTPTGYDMAQLVADMKRVVQIS
jgi:hypothetical protein